MSDAHKMFYTQEEIDNFTLTYKVKYFIYSIFYNVSEDVLCFIERFKK